MAIKTETTSTEELTFPCLMKSTKSSLVVLFYDKFRGTVIVTGSGWPVGMNRSDWAFADNADWWKLSPSVTISNA